MESKESLENESVSKSEWIFGENNQRSQFAKGINE